MVCAIFLRYMHTLNPHTQKAFLLKGSLFTLSILQLLSTNIIAFKQQLSDLDTTTLNFFNHAPMVLDLQPIAPHEEINFAEICTTLRAYNIFPVGIIGGSAAQQTAALANNLGLMNHPRNANKSKSELLQNPNTATIINKHIRSGQQIHAKGGDLIVIASVSAGAEILADSNIHVYGTLNGRASAGLNGDKTSRIFCHSLNAEVLSIAGIYQTNDEFPLKSALPVQIFLENDKLQIQNL